MAVGSWYLHLGSCPSAAMFCQELPQNGLTARSRLLRRIVSRGCRAPPRCPCLAPSCLPHLFVANLISQGWHAPPKSVTTLLVFHLDERCRVVWCLLCCVRVLGHRVAQFLHLELGLRSASLRCVGVLPERVPLPPESFLSGVSISPVLPVRCPSGLTRSSILLSPSAIREVCSRWWSRALVPPSLLFVFAPCRGPHRTDPSLCATTENRTWSWQRSSLVSLLERGWHGWLRCLREYRENRVHQVIGHNISLSRPCAPCRHQTP